MPCPTGRGRLPKNIIFLPRVRRDRAIAARTERRCSKTGLCYEDEKRGLAMIMIEQAYLRGEYISLAEAMARIDEVCNQSKGGDLGGAA